MALALFLIQRLSPPSIHSEKNQTAGKCACVCVCVRTHALVSSTFPLISPTFVFAPMRQVFVSCNFCGKSISYSCSPMPHQGRGFSQYGVSGSPTKSKVTSCPGCRKPLPRCALCLMNMGTPVSNCPGEPVAPWRGGVADTSPGRSKSATACVCAQAAQFFIYFFTPPPTCRNWEVGREGGLDEGEQTGPVQQLVHLVPHLPTRWPRRPHAQLVQVGSAHVVCLPVF